MKYALIIPDGCADEPQQVLGGRTPLQAARIPHMDGIARQGIVGRTLTIPESMTPGSDVGTMSLFGYDPLRYHTGRAPIEAAAQGIRLEADDWAIRCNLVTIEDGRMKSFTAGQFPSDAAARLIQRLQDALEADRHTWQFYAGVSYRNLLIHRGTGDSAPPFDETTRTVPPHDILDQPIAGHLPAGRGAEQLKELMQRAHDALADAPENRKRREQGELPATDIWLWGQGRAPSLEPFAERFGVQGAVVTAVDLLRGLARLVGWQVIEVPGATGYLDTDYAAKGRYAVQTLSDVDLVVVHVEATDEASHEGHAEAKVEALEHIDADIVGPIWSYLAEQGPYRILVSPDHPTLLRTRTHSHGEVPFAICGTGIEPDAAGDYSEATARTVPLKPAWGHELMPLLLGR